MSYQEDMRDDWSKYERNIPEDVLQRFAETISPFGSERIYEEHGEIRKEVYVASLERKTLNTVDISSVADRFLKFSLMSLDDEDPYVTNDILDSVVVVKESVDVAANDNTVTYLDYAVFDDPSIERIALRNPSAGTVSRVQELKNVKKSLEYVFLFTEAFKATHYYKVVADRIWDKEKILDVNDLSLEDRRRCVLYIGTVGNDMHKIPRTERDTYANVLGWAVNPFSPFNSNSVHALVRSRDGYEFQYDRRHITRIEVYRHDPDCYRYSAQASVAYVQDMTGRCFQYDKHQLVSHRYKPMEEGMEAGCSRYNHMERCIVPVRSSLTKKRTRVGQFGRIDVFYRGRRVYDLGLPFSYSDRYKYIGKFNEQIGAHMQPEDDTVEYAIAHVGDGYILRGGLKTTSFTYTKALKYECYDREYRAMDTMKGVYQIRLEGKDEVIESDVYVIKIGMYYHVYVKGEFGFGKQTQCYITDIYMPLCPTNGTESLTSGYSSVPAPPYFDDNYVPVKREVSPLHYNDYVVDRVKLPMPEMEMEFI